LKNRGHRWERLVANIIVPVAFYQGACAGRIGVKFIPFHFPNLSSCSLI